MPWTPAHASTDVRRIVGNLLAFFEANQVGALAWASPDRTLTPLALYPNVEPFAFKTTFPHLGVVRRMVTTDDSDDGLRVRYELVFEMEVETVGFTKETRTAALLQLQTDVDNYMYAFESMLLNIPDATLFANVTGVGHGRKTVTGSNPVEEAASDTRAMFNGQLTYVLEFVENP